MPAGTFSTINTKKVDDIIKDLEDKRKSERYVNDKLSIVQTINEYIFGVKSIEKISEKKTSVDVYHVEIQCNLDEKNQYDSDNDDVIIPSTLKKGHRNSMVQMKTKTAFVPVKKTEEEKLKHEKGDQNLHNEKGNKGVFTDELKKQILQSTELNEFLIRNSKYIERVKFFYTLIYFILIIKKTLGEKEIYDAFKGYYDENDDEDLE